MFIANKIKDKGFKLWSVCMKLGGMCVVCVGWVQDGVPDHGE